MTSPRFFSVTDNTLSKRGFPWIYKLGKGFREVYFCKLCESGRSLQYAFGAIEAFCERGKGVKWPDIIGCGHFPFFIVSARALSAFELEGIGGFPHHPVHIQPPIPNKLASLPVPQYFWLDGEKMRGALLDFEASGYVGVRFCPECGTRTDDISRTFARRNNEPYPFAFRPRTWRGAPLFTTDLSPCAFFCTEAFVNCARKHELINFEFHPVEEGSNSRGTGINYL